MGKRESGIRANIGTSSLILIFIVMCLVTFGMLSLTAAKNDLSLAERNASAVTEYYRADSEGEAFYAAAAEHVAFVCGRTSDETERNALFAEKFDKYYLADRGITATEIPMDRGQALYIELIPVLNGDGSVIIDKWKVIHTEDYEIDDSMPVWSGVEP